MRPSLPARLLAAALAALVVIPVVPAVPVAATETPTVEVTSSANPSPYGGSVTFTATVSGASGEATGSVQFVIDGAAFGAPVTLGVGDNGVAESASIDSLGAGNHAVTATFSSDNSTVYVGAAGTLGGGQAVSRVTLTVTPDPQALGYRAPVPTYTFSVTGWVLDEGPGTAAGYVAPACSSSYTTTTPVSSSPLTISCSGGSADNYVVDTSGTADLTISKATQATLSITGPATKTYGDAPFAPATSGGSTGSAITFTSSTPAVCTASNSPSVTIVAGGTCTITATMAGDANYLATTSAPFAVTVNPRAITVTADGKAKVYGDADPALTYQVTAGSLAPGDTLAGGLTRVAGDNVGARAIQQGTLSGGANYAITFVGANLTITKAQLTVTADDKTKVYGAANPSLTASYSGFKLGETLATSGVTGSPNVTTTATTASHVATYPITVTAGTLSSGNYSFSFVSGTLSVAKKTMTVTASSTGVTYGDPKPTIRAGYDQSAFVGNDKPNDLATRPTCTTDYDPYDPAGASYATTCSDGVDEDYDFAYVAGTVTVAKRALAVTADAQSRPYGAADPAFTFTYGAFVGTDGAGDIDTPPTCTTTATATSPVATYPITCSGGVDGNYAITYASANLSVTKAPLTVKGDNRSRTYGAANPAFTATLSGFANGETLGTSGVTGAAACTTTATTTSPVATYPITCATGTLAATNYAFPTFVAGTLTIGAAALSITANDVSRAYGDANPAFSVTYAGFVAGDDAADLDAPPTCTTTATPSTPVGTAAITCAGAADGNYTITHHPGTLTITQRPLAVTATGVNKVYDGTTAATVTLGDNRVASDTLTTSYASAAFASASAGSGKMVSVSGIAVTGADAGNYTWNTATTTTASVTQASVTASITAADKIYDGTATASATCALSGVLVADVAHVTCAGTATFADKNVGTGKTVTMTGITLAGTAAGNYSLSSTTDTDTSDITARSLTVTASGLNKVYDGTNTATVNLASNALAGDTVTLAHGGATFANKNVGTGKAVNVAGITIDGADAGNYALQNTTATTFANITRRTLTVTASADDKVYDGTTSAVATLDDDRVGGDILTIGRGPATFANRHIGDAKIVTIPSLALSGTDAGNYQLAATSVTALADITRRPITVTAVTWTKVYDGTLSAGGTPTITSGSLGSGDTVTWSQSYQTKTAGSGKVIIPAGTVSDLNGGNNYAVTFVNNTTGVITAKPLTVSGITASSKTYDGTAAAALVGLAGATLVGRVGADAVTLDIAGAIGTFADKNAGVGKPVQVAGLSIEGADGPNYSLTQPTATATISKATLTVTTNPRNRTYGAANPALTTTISGYVGGEGPATSGVTGSPFCTTTATVASGIGPYPIDCEVGTLQAANYVFAVVDGTLTIQPAPLTVTAEPKTRQFGVDNPSPTWAVSGFVLGETATTAAGFGGTPDCAVATAQGASVGTYPGAITCTDGTLAAANYVAGPFVPAALTVTPALAAPAVTSSANPAVASQDVVLTATVSWPIGAPTGTVTFYEGLTDLSGPVDLVGGVATFTTSWPTAGDEDLHPITAVYSGDGGNFGAAAAAPFNQVVGKSAVEVLLTASATTWEANVPLTFTADVHPVASGVTVPVEGTVDFRIDGSLAATVPVIDGTAAHATKLALGTRTVTASFTPAPAVASIFKAGASGPLAKTVVANTVSASGVGTSSTSIYPVADTWRDTVAIRGTRTEPLAVTITIYSPTGSKVRTKSFTRAAGTYSYTWNGRTSSGTILAAGKYKVVTVLADAWGARKTYTSYVTLSRLRMYWYTATLTVKPGPRNYQVRSTSNTDPTKGPILSSPSTTSTGALVMEQRSADLAWIAAGYQFTLPSASTYTSLSFQVAGSWTGTTAPKFGLVPWSGGDWFKAMYSTSRDRAAMDTIATDWDAHTPASLSGIRSGRYVRAVIDSFAGPSGWSSGPYRYSITAVRLVVRYGILK